MASTCRKFVHQTRESAEEHIRNLRVRNDEHPRRLERLSVYWCRACFAFHVGHRSTKTQSRERKKVAA